jgi:hypothetical protein
MQKDLEKDAISAALDCERHNNSGMTCSGSNVTRGAGDVPRYGRVPQCSAAAGATSKSSRHKGLGSHSHTEDIQCEMLKAACEDLHLSASSMCGLHLLGCRCSLGHALHSNQLVCAGVCRAMPMS